MKHHAQLTVELRLVITGREAVAYWACLRFDGLTMRAISFLKFIWYQVSLDVRCGRIFEASVLLIRGRKRTPAPARKSWTLSQGAEEVEPDAMCSFRTIRA